MKKLKIILVIIVCVAGLAFIAYKFFKAEKKEVMIQMNDGIQLNTTLFVPKGKGPFPTVLVRTPYSTYAEEWMGQAFNLFRIAVVLQDVRGKYKSEGEYYPFINERQDGLKTLKWIRDQPWSDGKVAGWGGSYVGYTQWAISDSLDFLTLLVTGANIYDFVYPDSLFSLQSAFVWGFQNASPNLNKLKEEDIKKSAMLLPLSSADDSTIKDIPFINDWILHEKYDSYWEKQNFRGKTTAPMITIAGWYDIFLKSQIADFQALEAMGENPGQRMIIGPYAHGAFGEPNDFGGIEKTGDPKMIFKYVKNILKGKKGKLSAPLTDTKYNLFIMERNEYVGSDVWPPAETTITPFYIGAEGFLDTSMFGESGSLQYEYSPANPYPSHGGTALGAGVGQAKQNDNVTRKDQLVFEKEIENQPVILIGPVSASLWLSSTAPCTDFMVQLQDAFPDGKIINIQEGGTKVKFNNEIPQKTNISVWATGYQIDPGHKLRVVITSSWFPRYNRSLNNCEPAFAATEMKDATQKLYFGKDYPSCINLPVYKIK
jgi:putative CocE/NonD family hydrolase